MACLKVLNARKFFKDSSGSVTVEFVIAMPILLAVLAFAVQYGNALKVRNSLDFSARDAARYLARAPLNSAGTDVDQIFKDRARLIIANRVETSKSRITTFSPVTDSSTASIDVTVDVPFPLLKWIGIFDGAEATMSMSTTESVLRTGDSVTTTSTSGS